MRHAPVRSGRGGKPPAPAPGEAILHVSHAHGELVPCIGPWERRLSSCLRQSAAVRGQTEETWPEVLGFKTQNLPYKYLSTYSPELNLVEILWRKIKYTWLPFSAYQCLNALRDALENILKNFGSKYQITFA